jgi:hypothetical protein
MAMRRRTRNLVWQSADFVVRVRTPGEEDERTRCGTSKRANLIGAPKDYMQVIKYQCMRTLALRRRCLSTSTVNTTLSPRRRIAPRAGPERGVVRTSHSSWGT